MAAASARPMIRLGIGMGSRFAELGSPSPVHVTRQVLVPPGVPAPAISAATPISELVRALNTQQPEVLVGAAGVWRTLAEEQRDGRLKIAPRASHFSSEPLSADLRRRVREAWGIEATEWVRRDRGSNDCHEQPRPPRARGRRGRCRDRDRRRRRPSGATRTPRRQGPAHQPDQLRATVDSLRAERLRGRVSLAQPGRTPLALSALGRWAYCRHPVPPRPGWLDGCCPSFSPRVGSRAHRRGGGSTHSYATRAGCTLRSCSLPELRPTSQTSCAAHWLLPSPRLVPYRLRLTSSQLLPCSASLAARSVWFDRFDQDHG